MINSAQPTLEGYEAAHDLMDVMVQNSQWPNEENPEDLIGEGNRAFIEVVGTYLANRNFQIRKIDDPHYPNRGLLLVEAGDPNAEQALVGISHADVVGVKDQMDDWRTDPYKLKPSLDNATWYGRGVCDTHGSGVAMLMALARSEVRSALEVNDKRISIIFTSDEEAAPAEWSFRGAKLAAGEYGGEVAIAEECKYFIAGEPTEMPDSPDILAMRAHKGRWLARVIAEVINPGHSAEDVNNALGLMIELGHNINTFSNSLRSISSPEADIFRPPYSSTQITGGTIKDDAFSTTPGEASFVVDLRTLPGQHEVQKGVLQSKIYEWATQFDGQLSYYDIQEIDDFAGTSTPINSPIVQAAEVATGRSVIGFNGGDEGEVLRRHGLEGVTIGPGKLSFAHQPNEQLAVSSLFRAVDIYSAIYRTIAYTKSI